MLRPPLQPVELAESSWYSEADLLPCARDVLELQRATVHKTSLVVRARARTRMHHHLWAISDGPPRARVAQAVRTKYSHVTFHQVARDIRPLAPGSF